MIEPRNARRWRGLWIACTVVLHVACGPAELGELPGITVLRDVTVIDGTGAAPMLHQAVVVEGDRIAAIGPVGHVEFPERAVVLDLSGKYVLPGFVDLHVHFPEDASVHQAMLDRLLEFGVTTILNPGARPGAGVALRERIRRGDLRGPRMFTAGRIIDYAPTSDGLASWAAQITTPEAMREEVLLQAAQGVDAIKLYHRLPPNLVAAAIEQARETSLPVIGHMGTTGWGEAARMGVSMLVHSGWGTPMDEWISLDDPDAASDTEWYRAYRDAPRGAAFARIVDSLVAADTVVVPTISITEASALGTDASLLPLFRVDLAPDADVADWWGAGWRVRHPQSGADSEEEAEMLATVYVPAILGIVRAYHERGVRLGVGTDVGNAWMTPGFVFHHELALFARAGIPPLDIVKMATYNGAAALGVLDDTGSVEVGKRADLLVLGGDPIADIANTRSIEAVFHGGRRLVP